MDFLRRFFRDIWDLFGRAFRLLREWLASPAYRELTGLLRVILLFGSLLFLNWLGKVFFEEVDAAALAQQWRSANPLIRWIPAGLMTLYAAFFNSASARYMLAPLAAFLYIFVTGSLYVQDVYKIGRFQQAAHYVISSLFSVFYPRLVIDNGQKVIPPGETNLLDLIGGPGYLIIQPGNAVLLEELRRPSGVLRSGKHFISQFENIGYTVSLVDQEVGRDEVETVTKDGIRVVVRDVRLRYRILPDIELGSTLARTQQNPYPFADIALYNMAYNLSVDVKGQDPWSVSVRRVVTGEITDYINRHTIDYLTAPRETPQDPRRELRERLMALPLQRRLSRLGAELLWVDVGHFDIVEEDVDKSRIGYWQSGWIGDAEVVRAYGEAKRQAYQELGRAEGQAELVMSIARALQEAHLATESGDNLHELFILRTAQVLDALAAGKTRNEESKPKG